MLSDTMFFFDLILLASGAYCLYTWVRLMATGHLFTNGLLLPKDKRVKDCSDEQGYIRAIRLPLGVMAVVTMAYGVFMIINDQLDTPLIPYPWSMLLLAAVLGALVWYGVVNRRANIEYFGM